MRFLQFLIMFWVGLYAQWALAFLPIQHWQTANGAQVYFVENHDLPILDLSIEFPAGSSTDTAETSGRAGLVQRLMSMGGRWSVRRSDCRDTGGCRSEAGWNILIWIGQDCHCGR